MESFPETANGGPYGFRRAVRDDARCGVTPKHRGSVASGVPSIRESDAIELGQHRPFDAGNSSSLGYSSAHLVAGSFVAVGVASKVASRVIEIRRVGLAIGESAATSNLTPSVIGVLSGHLRFDSVLPGSGAFIRKAALEQSHCLPRLHQEHNRALSTPRFVSTNEQVSGRAPTKLVCPVRA